MANVNSVQHAAKVEQSAPFLWGVYEIATALSAADTVTMFTIPAGTTVHGGWLRGDDIDTGTETLELDVGVSGNTDQFLNSGVIAGDAVAGTKPEAGIAIPLFGELKDGPITFTSDTDVILTVTAAAQAGGTGTLYLKMDATCFDARVSPPAAPI